MTSLFSGIILDHVKLPSTMTFGAVTLTYFLAVSCDICACQGLEIKGAGASFPVNVYTAWMSAFKAHRGPFVSIKLSYESIGSGGGISRMTGQTGPPVDYGASDSAMTEETYGRNPDLQMIPSMAGAIVMAYNIPTVTNLNLTLNILVDIYMGNVTRWNDQAIQGINPRTELPNETITVIARADKSGTTEMFTRALAAHSSQWQAIYGVFNKGIDTDYKPYHWNPEVVTLFGNTNRGVSGLVLSQYYSVSYMSFSETIAAKLKYVSLQNAAGNFVKPSVNSVQSAMNDFQQASNQRMTMYLVEPPGQLSYPLVGYTYLIIRMTTMTDCKTAEELIRYIVWFYTNNVALDICIQRHLVPLSSNMVSLVMDRVIRRVTCRKANVYSLVQRRLDMEAMSDKVWRVPIIASMTVFGLLMTLLLLYLVRHQIIINKGLLRNEWRIDIADIVIENNDLEHKHNHHHHHHHHNNKMYMATDNVSISAMSSLSYPTAKKESTSPSRCLLKETTLPVPPHRQSSVEVINDTDNDGTDDGGFHSNKMRQTFTLAPQINVSRLSLPSMSTVTSSFSHHCCQQTARWKSNPVMLRNLCFKRLEMTLSKKRKVLWLRDRINHPNICRFFGITFHEGTTSVFDYCSRGSLETILYDQKHTFNVQGKLAIAKEIVKGMEYLHKTNIVHSGLRASRCLVDDRWMLKITDWEVTSLVGDITARDEDSQEDIDWSNLLFWTAPEIIRFRFKATKSSDVYSFAMLMVEIFVQGCPFKGGNNCPGDQHPKDVLESITVSAWRPSYPQCMPQSVRGIVDRCWEMDPMARPSFPRLSTLLTSMAPVSTGVMHCLMDTLRDQNVHLEKQLQEKVTESELKEKQLEMVLAQTCPRHVAQQMAKGQPIRTTYVQNVTVVSTRLHNFHQLLQSLIYGMAIDLLCQMLTHLNELIKDSDYFRVDCLPSHIHVVSGLGRQDLNHAKVAAILAIDWLNYLKGVFATGESNLVFTVALCSGPVYTGVADIKSPRFLIIGETMRLAQELASTPEKERIPLCEATYECLQISPEFNTLHCQPDENHEKSSGNSYFLLGLNDRSAASLSKQTRLTSHRH